MGDWICANRRFQGKAVDGTGSALAKLVLKGIKALCGGSGPPPLLPPALRADDLLSQACSTEGWLAGTWEVGGGVTQ